MGKTKKSKKPVGRPTKYRPEYCKDFVEHLAQGFSIECFPATLYEKYGDDAPSGKETIYTWCENFPEFLDAKRRGESLGQKLWETIGRAGASGKLMNFNSTAWVFNMKNRYRWRNEVQIEHSGSIDSVSGVDISKLLKNPKTAALAHQLALELSDGDNESEES